MPRSDGPKQRWSRSPRRSNVPGTLLSGRTPSRRAPGWRKRGPSRHAMTWRKPTGKRRICATKSASYVPSWRRSLPSATPPCTKPNAKRPTGGQRVVDVRARHEDMNRQLREELAELRHELTTAREEVRAQRGRADRAEGRLDNATVAMKARRRQSYAGRGRRREGAPRQRPRRCPIDPDGESLSSVLRARREQDPLFGSAPCCRAENLARSPRRSMVSDG